MAQLNFSNIPGFTDLQASVFNPTNQVTDGAMKQLNENAKGGCVRPELIYMGWFKHADVVPLPVSPVDGYAYSRAEVRHIIQAQFSQPPGAGFVSGQKLRPAANPATGTAANGINMDIDDATGTVACNVYYNTGGATTDGILKVMALCTRLSVNNDGGTN